MESGKLFAEIEARYEEYLSVWKDICNLESPTADKAAVDAVGDYIATLAEQRGWEIVRDRQEKAGDVICITMNPKAKGGTVCLSGHMDTVYAIGSFGTPAVTEDAEKLYGPGVIDCKGGIAAALLAMDALANSGYAARPIRLILQSDEEGGSTQSALKTIEAMLRFAEGSVAFLNLEPFRRGKAVLGRKGCVNFTFTVKGESAHAGNCATEGASAIAEAAHKIVALERLKDAAGITCNVGTISGGTAPNCVPDLCSFKVNLRFASQEQFDWFCAYAEELANTSVIPGCTCTVERAAGYHPAMEQSERNEVLLDKMNCIWEKNGLSVLEATRTNGASDAAWITRAGIPCIDSLGADGAFLHSPREFAFKRSLAESAKRIAAVINELD